LGREGIQKNLSAKGKKGKGGGEKGKNKTKVFKEMSLNPNFRLREPKVNRKKGTKVTYQTRSIEETERICGRRGP